MASTFSWLDYSDRDRKRALDVIDLFREDDTRDELGLGVIRDAFADHLFPGTSTIQTRVRYFLFVPWLLRTLGPQDASADRFGVRVRQLHDRLRASLEAGGEKRGIVGVRARQSVQRVPSSIYWNGLRRWGILRLAGSEEDYRRALARQAIRGTAPKNDDGEPVGDDDGALWDSRLLPPPDSWLTSTTFSLQRKEGEYLTHCIRATAGESLLAELIHLGIKPKGASLPWELVNPTALPQQLANELTQARNFSESMHGAALLYNLMLAEERKSDELVDQYHTSMAEWWNRLSALGAELGTWDHLQFWSLLAGWQARVSAPCRAFVQSWLDAIRALTRVEAVIDSGRLRGMIRSREQALKGPRARMGNARALNLWSGHAGTARIDYRWQRPVAEMLRDLSQAGKTEV